MPTNEDTVMVETAPNQVKAEDYQPITDSKNVEKFINDYFADIPILAEIAKCESTFRHYDSNGDVLKNSKSSAIGAFQIMASLHEKRAQDLGIDIRTLEGNAEFAEVLYEEQGAKPWMASSACWAKFSQSEIAKR